MIVEMCNNQEQVTQKLLLIFCEKVKECLKTKEIVQVAVATGNTFSSFLDQIKGLDIPLNRIDLFVVDEYAGVNYDDERSCTIDLCRDLKITNELHKTYFFDAISYHEQVRNLNEKLYSNPLDILLLGIGTDGHFAFCFRNETYPNNDTYLIMRFADSDIAKQVENGWFPNVDMVPKEGITITKYGVMKSGTVILAGYRKDKENILKMIISNSVPEEMPIYEIIQRNDVILVSD